MLFFMTWLSFYYPAALLTLRAGDIAFISEIINLLYSQRASVCQSQGNPIADTSTLGYCETIEVDTASFSISMIGGGQTLSSA